MKIINEERLLSWVLDNVSDLALAFFDTVLQISHSCRVSNLYRVNKCHKMGREGNPVIFILIVQTRYR
jgi:hypothetical protein